MHTCISSHGLKRSWRSCPRRVNAGNKNTPSTHHPRRWNVTTSLVGLKKRSHTQKSHPKVLNPRDIAGKRQKKKKKKGFGVQIQISINSCLCKIVCIHWPEKMNNEDLLRTANWGLVCLFVGCLTSQQQASVSEGRICSDNFTCCHTEIEIADQTFYLTQSQYTDTGLTSPSADPITPGAWQGSHWSANFWVTGMTRPRKNPGAGGNRTQDLPLSRRTP